jgi:hypothetical protein
MTEQKLLRLPKWAQSLIRTLENRNQVLNDLLQAYVQKNGAKSKVYIQEHNPESNEFDEYYVPNRTNITFQVGDDKRDTIELGLSFNDDDKAIVVYGMNRIKVIPSASNCIKITLDN